MRDGHPAIGFGTDHYAYTSSESLTYSIGIGIITHTTSSYGECPAIEGCIYDLGDTYFLTTILYLSYHKAGSWNVPGGAIVF